MRRTLAAMLRTPLGATALALLALVVLTAIIAPLLWGAQADATDTGDLLAGPSAEHLVGTDNLGRDLLLRTIVATRLSIVLALLATLVSVVAGLVLGVAPLLLGSFLGRAMTWFTGIAVAFPGLLLALFFAAIFGSTATAAVFALGLAGAPSFARLCQNLIAGIEARDFVSAARVGGIGRFKVLFRHVLPNIGEPLIVNATIGAGGALLAFAGLSFLGLGVQPPDYDWGRLMMDGLRGIYANPLAALAPGLAVVVAGLAFNLTGESAARSLGISDDVLLSSVVGPRRMRRTLAKQAAAADATPAPAGGPVLEVEDLRVDFEAAGGKIVHAVRGIDLTVAEGEIVGIVGESGSGKSMTALAVAQLVSSPGRVEASALRFLGVDLRTAGKAKLRRLLGTSMAMVFQDPMSSFNPTMRMGDQLAEVATEHAGLSRREALARATDRLAAVRISAPKRRVRQYPYEFSGGMRQRAMIGMGLMVSPKLIIADEPTTALDVTVQAQVLDLLRAIRDEEGTSILFISHDISVVAELCDRVLVMRSGEIVEELQATDLSSARHPYTRALLAAVPHMGTDLDRPLATLATVAAEEERVADPAPTTANDHDAQEVGSR
ncbi:dipeptide/oligopeptide/nickel ABC transporter permease/ATP-binding protein [Microbacterium sp. W4I20]|uniref:dipeptide/oligopeptide/nickel ABC transporter permease/ATP-binding protein n=1 Tax=Microbacterium sp. W4I20 TaxID=3042262 RepID=UPI002787E120|nr:dipeptide/oligopeptide/nickel ABC transporter permease/ATP-binding protein [Microbacterium sp. W4I20]MDQ0728213.1 peptide/nickel transport system permease protein [Microbacterium sp. W4I20]